MPETRFLLEGREVTVEDDCPPKYRLEATLLLNELRCSFESLFISQLEDILNVIMKHPRIANPFEIASAIYERFEKVLEDPDLYDYQESDKPFIDNFMGDINSLQFQWHRELLGEVAGYD